MSRFTAQEKSRSTPLLVQTPGASEAFREQPDHTSARKCDAQNYLYYVTQLTDHLHQPIFRVVFHRHLHAKYSFKKIKNKKIKKIKKGKSKTNKLSLDKTCSCKMHTKLSSDSYYHSHYNLVKDNLKMGGGGGDCGLETQLPFPDEGVQNYTVDLNIFCFGLLIIILFI